MSRGAAGERTIDRPGLRAGRGRRPGGPRHEGASSLMPREIRPEDVASEPWGIEKPSPPLSVSKSRGFSVPAARAIAACGSLPGVCSSHRARLGPADVPTPCSAPLTAPRLRAQAVSRRDEVLRELASLRSRHADADFLARRPSLRRAPPARQF